MKAFAMLGLDKIGFIEKERPVCGPYDAICRPLAISPCTSDVHTVEVEIGRASCRERV